ncbi:hypothetical protein BCR32DRAFT_286819 [Anaeromyces robustus]|uniref:Uncharacterized protein n=1 Tax=Anaeromyces robustus TaxID=1754192 RepID=A0A1Y1VUH6_9FUNG|nr:hypothetical protein BCR32DRAFT_286819 [Anaeromyces robustus]|eukprot:ORX64843.1 hypothetical protein BCR32DRAFT_286819 [Anaeromyces robustus]
MIDIANKFISYKADINYLLDIIINSELLYDGLNNLIYIVFNHMYPNKRYVNKNFMANIYTDKKNELIPYAYYLTLNGYKYSMIDKVKININDLIKISKYKY